MNHLVDIVGRHTNVDPSTTRVFRCCAHVFHGKGTWPYGQESSAGIRHDIDRSYLPLMPQPDCMPQKYEAQLSVQTDIL